MYKQLEKYFETNKEAVFGFVVLIVYNDSELSKACEICNSNINEKVETIIIDCNLEKYKSASKK